MIHFFKLLRWKNLLLLILTQILVKYALLEPLRQNYSISLALSTIDFIYLIIATVFIAAAGYIINDIEDVVIGCAFQVGEQCFNIGKLVTFLTGMDIKTSGMTVDRWCGSSMEAIHVAAGKIAMGSGKAFICGGVESMTRVNTGFDPMPYPYSDNQNPNVYFSMGITAENVAKKYNITRKTFS